MYEIVYVNFHLLGLVIYYNCIKHPSWRRILFTIPSLFILIGYVIFLTFFRLLDEVLFWDYRKVKILKPLFIISNPRSGTTYLHRLLTLDEDRYTYPLLYHTLLPSVVLLKLMQVFSRVDQKMGGPFKRLFGKLDEFVFSGWKDIHPIGLNMAEEDEGYFTFMMLTPALVLLSPFISKDRILEILDHADSSVKEKVKAYYLSTIKRFYYAEGMNKTLLNKNVFSSGRLGILLEIFPDAQIIYPVRNPFEAIPSGVSMFTVSWKVHSPEIPMNSEYAKQFGHLLMYNYAHFFEAQKKIDGKRLISFSYETLIDHPVETVMKIYAQFEIEFTPAYAESLAKSVSSARSYKSRHQYTLEQFGLDHAFIYQNLEELFVLYGFKKVETN